MTQQNRHRTNGKEKKAENRGGVLVFLPEVCGNYLALSVIFTPLVLWSGIGGHYRCIDLKFCVEIENGKQNNWIYAAFT
jgi:hypothetical protein